MNICILFGSQTGQAKSIAESLYDKYNANIDIKLFELDEIEKNYELNKINYAIIICSTTGDGDAPENASKFLRLLKLYNEKLTRLNFTVLGLGDTNYSNFCNCGKMIDKLLYQSGANRFYESGWADDAIGLEIVIEPWLEGLYTVIKNINFNELDQSMSQLKIYNYSVQSTEVCNEINHIDSEKDEIYLIGDELTKDLENKPLSVPLVPPEFLEIIYQEEKVSNTSKALVTTAILPSDKSGLVYGKIDKIEKITEKFAVKTVHKVTFDNELSKNWSLQCGDTVGVLPQNNSSEVDEILNFLLKSDKSNKADLAIELSILANTEKRRAKVPDHLIVDSKCEMSLRTIFLWLLDIRLPLSKAGLRIMAEYCPSGSKSRRRLLELCSREGQALYTNCIHKANTGLLDLLKWFNDCEIPVARLLEVLPRLKPRAYSLCDLNKVEFAFSQVDIAPAQPYRKRPLKGVCTSWLENLSKLEEIQEIPIYLRKNLSGFTITEENASKPQIFIGPGTGIAPFITFLLYLQQLKDSGKPVGEVWMFFGCRNIRRDFIFREAMLQFLRSGVLSHLCVCFSRDKTPAVEDDKALLEPEICCPSSGCKYVQDCMWFHHEQLSSLVVDQDAMIYVCGDASGMAKDTQQKWAKIVLQHNSELSNEKSAESYISKLRINKRYLEDIWA